jgi:hypothetical protein
MLHSRSRLPLYHALFCVRFLCDRKRRRAHGPASDRPISADLITVVRNTLLQYDFIVCA